MLRTHAVTDDYLKATGYRNPKDAYNGPWQYAYHTDKHYFDWLNGNEVAQKAFNAVMTMQQQFRGQDWFDFYPVKQNLVDPFITEQEKDITTTTTTLLVDIGGSTGHDALAFTQKFLSSSSTSSPAEATRHRPGTVTVQDLPRVIDSIPSTSIHNLIHFQAHDMFKPQPIRNAKAYYLRNVLHDWPDKQAVTILQRVREACGPQSRLLVNENIVPEDHVSPVSAIVDMVMMTTCSAWERSEKQWTELLVRAGFKVVRVWKPSEFQVMPVALFEAVPGPFPPPQFPF